MTGMQRTLTSVLIAALISAPAFAETLRSMQLRFQYRRRATSTRRIFSAFAVTPIVTPGQNCRFKFLGK
jgi:hypothetical protein